MSVSVPGPSVADAVHAQTAASVATSTGTNQYFRIDFLLRLTFIEARKARPRAHRRQYRIQLGAGTEIGYAADARRYVTTASTRRCVSPSCGRSSFPRMERTC